MPAFESTILCGLAILFSIDTIRTCFLRNRETHYDSMPLLIRSIVQYSHHESFNIQTVAPLSNDTVNEEDICPICFDKLHKIRYRRKTICGHTFCSECIQEWFHKKKCCPVCMQSFEIS